MQVKIVWTPLLATSEAQESWEQGAKDSFVLQKDSVQTKRSQASNMHFVAEMAGHTIDMDARPPVGGDNGATPKHLLLASICGCTAMDVVALMRKFRQELKAFEVEADAEASTGHPSVFADIYLKFHVTGKIEEAKLLEAVKLSQTKYCGVSAMVSKACKIWWQAFLNGEKIGDGNAHFEELKN